MDIIELFIQANGNANIQQAFAKALNQYRRHNNIAVSVSGGKDSDIVVDIMSKLDDDKKIRYIWFDTGLEYRATKEHLSYLEEKYDIVIERIKAIKSIPLCCKTYGQPFLSKNVSQMIYRLQKHNFKWEDKPYEELMKIYPNCKAALDWWCNTKGTSKLKYSMFNINYNRYLKEFMIENPPTFRISDKCCTYAKKEVSRHFIRNEDIDLIITGIRKSEGGDKVNLI